MPDELDLAQQREQNHRDDAILRVRLAARRERRGESGREDCLRCGEEIPEARRAAVPGCCRCVLCQTIVDRSRACAR